MPDIFLLIIIETYLDVIETIRYDGAPNFLIVGTACDHDIAPRQ